MSWKKRDARADSTDAIKQYRKRRQERIDKRNGVIRKPHYDSVEEYRKRREKRLEARADASVGWVYGILQQNGIDTKGMDVKEAFEELAKLNGGKGGKGGKDEKGGKGGKSGEAQKGSESKSGSIKKSEHRNHEYDGSGYKGEPGEVKSGKSGNLKPKSEKSKRIDTSDATAETERWKQTNGKEGLEKNSLTGFVDKDGNLTPERQKVHDEIVQAIFADKVPQKGKATMTMSGGGPASGKSFIEKNVRQNFGDETCITVDPDKLKEMLPGYTDMAIESDAAAGFYHEESSALAKRVYQYGLDNNINVVYDGTGDGSVNSVKKKIQAARDAGYAVNGEYVTVDVDGPNGALARNQARYENGRKKFESGKSDVPPRLPKESHVKQIHAAVSDIIPEVANEFDEWKLWDNNGEQGSPRTLIATCKRGGKVKVEPGQEGLMEKFLNKGEAGYQYSNGEFKKK